MAKSNIQVFNGGVAKITVQANTDGRADEGWVYATARQLATKVTGDYQIPYVWESRGPYGLRMSLFAPIATAAEIRGEIMKFLAELGA